MKYYDITNICNKNCNYNFIISGRGPGKTTAMVNYLIDRHFQHTNEDNGLKSTFVRIARYDWEVSKTLMSLWFNEVNRKHLKDKYNYDVEYNNLEWRISNDGFKTYEVIGRLVTLNNQDIFKSVSYDSCTDIVFEEFIQMNERDYVSNEVELYMSALSTIARTRKDIKAWFIGNTLNKHNPYFDYFGIDIDRLGIKQGDLKTFRCGGYGDDGATIAVEYAIMSYESKDEIPAIMRISNNVVATDGNFAESGSVKRFDLVSGLPESMFKYFLGVKYVYGGGGLFYKAVVTKRVYESNLLLMAFFPLDPNIIDLKYDRFLNLSDAVSPSAVYADVSIRLHVLSKNYFWSNNIFMNKLKKFDMRCIHAYCNDDIRYKWRNFVDMYDGGDANELS